MTTSQPLDFSIDQEHIEKMALNKFTSLDNGCFHIDQYFNPFNGTFIQNTIVSEKIAKDLCIFGDEPILSATVNIAPLEWVDGEVHKWDEVARGFGPFYSWNIHPLEGRKDYALQYGCERIELDEWLKEATWAERGWPEIGLHYSEDVPLWKVLNYEHGHKEDYHHIEPVIILATYLRRKHLSR